MRILSRRKKDIPRIYRLLVSRSVEHGDSTDYCLTDRVIDNYYSKLSRKKACHISIKIQKESPGDIYNQASSDPCLPCLQRSILSAEKLTKKVWEFTNYSHLFKGMHELIQQFCCCNLGAENTSMIRIFVAILNNTPSTSNALVDLDLRVRILRPLLINNLRILPKYMYRPTAYKRQTRSKPSFDTYLFGMP